MAQYTRPPMDPALVHEALRPYPSGPPETDLSDLVKVNATIATLEQCERDFKAKVLSRALAEKAKLNETYRQNPSDEDAAASSDAETRRRNTAVVRALRTTSSRSSHAGPPLFNPATRSSARPNTRDRDRDREHSRAGSHSAKMAQLVEDTVWKLDAYDNQPRRMRDKYYAYREWLVRNEGTVPMDIDSGANPPAAGGSASASSSTMMIPKSTTGSTNYDASRDPRLHR